MIKHHSRLMIILLLGCSRMTLFATKSLLYFAKENKKELILEALKKTNCTQNEKNLALLAATKKAIPPNGSENDRLSIINILLDHGAKIDCASTKKETGLAGGSPLFFAIEESYEQRVELLLQRGADPNWTDHRGYTPLIRACINGDMNIVVLLCQYGADVHTQSKTGSGVLSFCAMRKYSDLTKELLQRGAYLSATEKIKKYAKSFIEKTSKTATKQRLICLKETLQSTDRFYDDLMRLFLHFDGSEHLWNTYKQLS